jgi:signal transduction histidine kinase
MRVNEDATVGVERSPVRSRGLLDAMLGIASGLSLQVVLHHITEEACRLVDARYGALGVIGDDQQLTQFIAVGIRPERMAEIGHYPEGLGILGLLIVDPEPLRLRDLTTHPKSFGFPENHPPMHSFLGVPIRIRDEVFGNLYLCEKTTADEFSDEDEATVVSLAATAAVAVENSRLHERLQDLAVLRDRERIARDLHDKVIQRLFAAGMRLQATARLAESADVEQRLVDAVDELDGIITDIRSTIFELGIRPSDRPSLSASVLALVDESVRPAGIEPTIRIDGALDVRVEPALGDDVLAVLREALTNVVRHATASTVAVDVVLDESLTLRIADNGSGIDPDRRRSTIGYGLRNLEIRARARGGTCSVRPRDSGGTAVEWQVPLELG